MMDSIDSIERRCRVIFLVLPLLLGAGCAETIDVAPGPGQLTMAIFDFSTTPPQLPFPTDLLMDRATGLVSIPPGGPTQPKAPAYLEAFLNTLNGFPAMIPGEVHFSGELDKSTVTATNIVVLETDPTDPTKVTPVTGATFDYKTEAKGTSVVRIYPPGGMAWKRGARYLVYVVGGAKGLKDKAGKPVYRSPFFEMAAGANPLCDWDKDRSWDASSMTCATTAPGGKASGCCTFNYNGMIDSSTRKEVRAANPDLSLADVEALAKRTVLERVTQFESMRQSFGQLLDLAGKFKIARDDVAVLWSFKIQDMNQAVFNPTTTPPQGPFPTDMLLNRKTGLLDLPKDPSASKAEQAFNAYLRTLNGFPMGFPGIIEFTRALDKTSTDKGALIFAIDRTSTPPKATKVDNVVVSYNEAKNQLVVAGRGGLKHATTHVMVALGGTSGLKNKTTTFTASPARTAFMHLALSPHALCDQFDATTASCGGNPTVNVFVDAPTGAPSGLTAKQQAAMFESVRLIYDPLVKAILAADSSLKREDIRSLTSWTTTSMTMINIDPENGQLPYPSDLMLDPKTGKVSIPATPGESPGQKALREGLNTLDGFTTQGTFFVPVAGKLDAASITAANAVLTLNVQNIIPGPAPMTVAVDNTAGAITFTPLAPLKEKNRYGMVLTSKRKDGSLTSQGGLKDDKGNYVVPSPSTVLLRGADPVYDTTTKKSLVSMLDDATAAQIEAGRLQAKPMFDGLKMMGIQPEDVVGAWSMTTMSITEAMTQLRALPYSALAKADLGKPKLVGALDKTLASWPKTTLEAPKTSVAGIVASGKYSSWWAIDPASGVFGDPTKGKQVDVPFQLTVPSGTAPATGWPVVIYVHGIYQSKAEALALASANAVKGLATLSFDMPYHGARSWCVKDEECDAGGTCTVATGTCSTKLADKDSDGFVDASGNDKFLNLQNPFAIRDNLRQAVIDASALLRAVLLGGASGITGGPVKLDPAKVTIAGYSTGAIVATAWLAVEGSTVRGALNAPGLRLAEMILGPNGGKRWETLRKATFKAQGITEGSIEALRFVTTFAWILEPADAGNFARHIKKVQLPDLLKAAGAKVPAKAVILQQAEKDESVPQSFSDALAKEIGVVSTKTLFTGQGHDMFMAGDPDLKATQACRTQMANFLKGGVVCTPAVSSGKYTGLCN